MKPMLYIKKLFTAGLLAAALAICVGPQADASTSNPWKSDILSPVCGNGKGKDGTETHGRQKGKGKDGTETHGRGKDGNETHG